MDDNPPNGSFWLRALTVLAIAAVTIPLLFPAIGCGPIERGRSQAKSDVVSLKAALQAYNAEYGKWPDFTDNGLFLDEKRQAQLLRMLQGKDEANNPRKIIFFEGRTATDVRGARGQYRGGCSPATGAYLDAQGNPYRIAIDADNDELIASPYPDGSSLRINVIVWSLGKDGKQGSPANPHTSKGSDDVTSWQ